MKRQLIKPPKVTSVIKGYTPKAEGRIPKAKDINQMSSDEIRENLTAIKYAQMSLKAKMGQGGKVENTAQVKNNRRTMARMMTVLVKRGERCI